MIFFIFQLIIYYLSNSFYNFFSLSAFFAVDISFSIPSINHVFFLAPGTPVSLMHGWMNTVAGAVISAACESTSDEISCRLPRGPSCFRWPGRSARTDTWSSTRTYFEWSSGRCSSSLQLPETSRVRQD